MTSRRHRRLISVARREIVIVLDFLQRSMWSSSVILLCNPSSYCLYADISITSVVYAGLVSDIGIFLS